MKKYRDFYYTTKHMETVSRNDTAALKMYAWFIRNEKGKVLQSSLDKDLDWGDSDGLYYNKREAEIDAQEAIIDHYD
jgi:hypothetical protein